MKTAFLLLSFSVAMAGQAQKSSRIFATVDPKQGGFNWSSIHQLNSKGQDEIVINNQKATGIVIDAQRQQKKADFSPTATNLDDQPLFSGVAALAFDIQHNRLYFSTMFTQQLRYLNLGSKQTTQYYQVANIADVIKSREPGYKVSNDFQGPVITRMTIGGDGYGYGLSNDGNSFFRFSLNKKTTVVDLGALVDDASNGTMSVHNQCSSWGGDMVAADNGDLYLITMRQQVFRINPDTRVATHIGAISGLDDKFSVNGAAVDEDGTILLSNAYQSGSRARLADVVSLKATEEKNESFYNASDLASGNLIKTGIPIVAIGKELPVKEVDAAITAFPNPIVDGFTLLQFNKIGSGRFTIDMLSSAGNMVSRKAVQISSEGQQVKLNTNSFSKGFYIIKAIDANTKAVFTTKVVIQ